MGHMKMVFIPNWMSITSPRRYIVGLLVIFCGYSPILTFLSIFLLANSLIRSIAESKHILDTSTAKANFTRSLSLACESFAESPSPFFIFVPVLSCRMACYIQIHLLLSCMYHDKTMHLFLESFSNLLLTIITQQLLQHSSGHRQGIPEECGPWWPASS